jgi:hypothetical protein
LKTVPAALGTFVPFLPLFIVAAVTWTLT